MLKHPLPSPLRKWTGSALLATLLASATLAAWASQPATPTNAKPLQVVTDNDVLTQPKYPASALAQGISGLVVLDLHVGEDGQPTEIRVVRSSPEGVFEKYALAAAEQWRFNAGRNGLRGKKVEGWIRVPVQFTADAPPAGTEVE